MVGQKLKGTVVQELLDGKTGPKLFLEVGAGRTDSRGKWTIVFGMARLSRGKDSVIRKRASRLRTKESIDVWVSRVQKDCGRLEVCLGEEELVKYLAKPKRNVSTLQEGEEVIGKVVRVENYGVVIDVGANRPGLLHILKVRSLYGKYVDGEKGLIDVGLGRGARVRLCVELVKKRRLSLDFTDDVKDEAKAALETTAAERKTVDSGEKNDMQSQMEMRYRSTENVAQGTNYAADGNSGTAFTNDSAPIQGEGEVYEEESDDNGDDDDDYDEDRDIEDSLGLGFY
jgi:predicted RNA-binding protein with RPS1 domain